MAFTYSFGQDSACKNLSRVFILGNPIMTSSLAGAGAPRFSVSSDISIIDQSHVNETMWNSTVMSASGSSLPGGLNKRSHVLDVVNVAELTKGKKTLFLDGCKIFVQGMQTHHAEKCVKLINSGTAIHIDGNWGIMQIMKTVRMEVGLMVRTQ